MKDAKDSWKQDVENLLEQSVVEDAVARVLAKLDAALGELDADSREVLSRFFEGTSIATLSEEKGVSQEEIKLWIERAKRKLNQQLRTRCAVRQ
jgi:DNA-directed RNA polymerase specialized sigma24 family protein